jgi:chromatin segregation and condensation protein Rec8/ScpA/Scc1 (kleisin family)
LRPVCIAPYGSSTFIASLELARQGEVVLGQEQDFQPIHVATI